MVLGLEILEKESKQDYLLKYLMLKLAAVLVEVKPSCLLALYDSEKSGGKNHFRLWKEQRDDIVKTLGVSFKELRNTSRGKQVLFYNPKMLLGTIRQPENLRFLRKFGYFSCKTTEDYLKTLKEHFNSSFFPHEIGIFLGYPLKDVQGFIEKGSLPLVKVGSWQVFGKVEESMQLMNMHKKAEEVFSCFIENRKNPMPYVGRLSAHFKKVNNLVRVN